jgi:hypothetical protein
MKKTKFYIEFKDGTIIYIDSECEMWKTLYFNDKPVECYGEVL